METIFGFALLIGTYFYFKSKKNKSTSKKSVETNKKSKSVTWLCDRCGNDWKVNEPVPKDYKSKERNTTADGKSLPDNVGRPWVCSDFGTYTLTNPQK